MTHEELRQEFVSMHKTLADACGTKCVCCGSEEAIQYHHILPIMCGGDNRLSNIAPVCARCHKAIHHEQEAKKYTRSQLSGRPSAISDKDAEPILDSYFSGEIGTNECWEALGYGGSLPRLATKPVVKRYIKANGIKSYRNNVDLRLKKNGKLTTGEEVGYVEYNDGRIETMLFGRDIDVRPPKQATREDIERFLYGDRRYEKMKKA